MAKALRTYIDAPAEMVDEIERFMKAERYVKRAEAIRRLLNTGLKVWQQQNQHNTLTKAQ